MTYDVVSGWTGHIDVDLLTKGATPSGTMAGMTAELILRDSNGNTITTTGDVSVQDSTNWVVRYSPDATDFVPGVYRGRFKVTDSAGLIVYFPSAEADTWIVRSDA